MSYEPDRRRLAVYVPGPGSFQPAPRSAIVGTPTETGVVIDYEGDIYGWGLSYRERLAHAADRHIQHYPTVARASVPAGALVRVGSWHAELGVLEVEDPDALSKWAPDWSKD